MADKKSRKDIFNKILKDTEKEEREKGKNVLNSGERREELIDKYVNQPLAKRGHENIGAGLSTILAELGDYALPSSADSETADAALPGSGLVRRGAKVAKKARKDILDDIDFPEPKKVKPKAAPKESPTLDYSKMAGNDNRQLRRLNRESEANAGALSYDSEGNIVERIKPKKIPSKKK